MARSVIRENSTLGLRIQRVENELRDSGINVMPISGGLALEINGKLFRIDGGVFPRTTEDERLEEV